MRTSNRLSVSKKNHSHRTLRIEALEDRQLLAGGGLTTTTPVTDQTAALLAQIAALQAQLTAGGGTTTPPQISAPSPMVEVRTLATPEQHILPGAPRVRLLDLEVSATKPNARFETMTIVSTTNYLASSAFNFTLWADMNTNRKDGVNGCETSIAVASMDWQTGVLDFSITMPVWARQTPTHLAVTADFSEYLSSDAAGIDVAWATFRDVRGRSVPDSNVSFTGAPATVHVMENAVINFSPAYMLPAQSAVVGQQNAELFIGSAWGNNSQPTNMAFVAVQGKLAYASNYVLSVDTNYDGKYEQVFANGVVRNSLLNFKLTGADFQSSSNWKFMVSGNIASNTAGQHLQLGFPANGQGITGINSQTGSPLMKVAVNGGEGQIRIFTQNAKSATVTTIVNQQPVLAVKEVGAGQSAYQQVSAGQTNVVLDTFTAYAYPSQDAVVVNSVAITAIDGDFSIFTAYAFWWDSNDDGVVDTSTATKPRQDGKQMYFEDLGVQIPAGKTVLMEVHADVDPDADATSAYGCLRAGISQDGIKATESAVDLALKDIWVGHEWPRFYYLGNGQG